MSEGIPHVESFEVRVIANGYVLSFIRSRRPGAERAEMYHPTIDSMLAHVGNYLSTLPLPAVTGDAELAEPEPAAEGGRGEEQG